MYNTEEFQSSCPYCGEAITLIIDRSLFSQQYIEDCHVCCRPIEIIISETADKELCIALKTDTE